MHILIFGGTGFVGRALTRELVEKGYDVTIVTRSAGKYEPVQGKIANTVHWDTYSSLPVDDLPKTDVIVNLAGESIGKRRWTKKAKKEILNSRVRVTSVIAEAIRKGLLKPGFLINASGANYYGKRGDEKITETDTNGDDFLAHVCRLWEDEAYSAETGLTRVVTLRTGIVVGDNIGIRKMATPVRYFIGGPAGSGNQWHSWIHIDDLVGIIRFIIEQCSITGPVNAVSPNPVRNRELFRTLGRVLNRPSWLPVPGFALKMVLGQMAEMLLHGQRLVPEKLTKAGYEFKYPGLREALEDAL